MLLPLGSVGLKRFFYPLEFYKNFMICHDLLLDKNKKSPDISGAGCSAQSWSDDAATFTIYLIVNLLCIYNEVLEGLEQRLQEFSQTQ